MRLAPLVLIVAACASCALVDPDSYSFRYLGGIEAGEGNVSGDGNQQGRWKFRGADGRVLAEGEYVDDVQVGPWTYFYENGNLKLRTTLVDKRREGLFQSWHPNAARQSRGRYVNGFEFGEWRFWNPRDELVERGPLFNGLREGHWRYYDSEGSVEATGLYREGVEVGLWTLRADDGSRLEREFPMPEGLEWVRETWDDGTTVRREGFLVDGRPAGLWTTYHRDGQLRATGVFERGVPDGRWLAFGPAGGRMAEGDVRLGRPSGIWQVETNGKVVEVDAATFRSAPPAIGAWSERSIAASGDVGSVVATWLGEARSPLADDSVVAQVATRSGADAGMLATVREAAVHVAAEPNIPVQAQPFTRREQEHFADLVATYSGDASARRRVAEGYAGVLPGSGGSAARAFPESGGDARLAQQLMGAPLPMSVFLDENGENFDIASRLRGRRVVLVVLRGFEGKICPYCVAQTAAMCDEGAIAAFEERGVELQVVYPGSTNGLQTFKQAYQKLTRYDRIYSMLYENDYKVGKELGIEGSKVIPSTFILDEQGTVRFAYIGVNEMDRPPLPLLLEEIEKLDAKVE